MPTRRSASSSSSASSASASSAASSASLSSGPSRRLTPRARATALNARDGNGVWEVSGKRLRCRLCNKDVTADTIPVYQHRRGMRHQSLVRDARIAVLGAPANAAVPVLARSPVPMTPPLTPLSEAPARRPRSADHDAVVDAMRETTAAFREITRDATAAMQEMTRNNTAALRELAHFLQSSLRGSPAKVTWAATPTHPSPVAVPAAPTRPTQPPVTVTRPATPPPPPATVTRPATPPPPPATVTRPATPPPPVTFTTTSITPPSPTPTVPSTLVAAAPVFPPAVTKPRRSVFHPPPAPLMQPLSRAAVEELAPPDSSDAMVDDWAREEWEAMEGAYRPYCEPPTAPFSRTVIAEAAHRPSLFDDDE